MRRTVLVDVSQFDVDADADAGVVLGDSSTPEKPEYPPAQHDTFPQSPVTGMLVVEYV